MFGDWWGGIIGLIAVAAIFNGNNGLFGGNGNAGAAVQRGFDTQAIISKLDGINSGICDGFYAMNTSMLTGFGNVQQSLCQGFSGITNAINTGGYETRSAITDLGYRLQQCCCEQKQIALENRYLNERQTCDLITNQNANTQRIIDMFTSNKMSELQSENAALKGQISQNAQTSTIIGALSPKAPIAAYQVPNPFTGVYGNSNCGC